MTTASADASQVRRIAPLPTLPQPPEATSVSRLGSSKGAGCRGATKGAVACRLPSPQQGDNAERGDGSSMRSKHAEPARGSETEL